MACGEERQVKVTQKEGRNKMDGEKKRKKSGKIKGLETNEKKCMQGPCENRPTTPTKKALEPAFLTIGTSRKVLFV